MKALAKIYVSIHSNVKNLTLLNQMFNDIGMTDDKIM